MDKLGPSPFCWLQYDASGNRVDPDALTTLAQSLDSAEAEDLVVISHGWNSSKADALSLYSRLWANVTPALKDKKPEKIVVCGIQWPAKQFSTDFDVAALASADDGATLAAHVGAKSRDLTPDELDSTIEEARQLFGPAADAMAVAAKKAAAELKGSTSRALFEAVKDLIDVPPSDSELEQDARPLLDAQDPHLVLGALATALQRQVDPDAAATMGLKSMVGSLITGSRAAVARLLNYLTYYEMKKRAGVVGQALGSAALPALAVNRQTSLHLIGHSFGARLVTAAANALPATLPKIDFTSLTLLQGAFSHNAFRTVVIPGVSGAFLDVIGKPGGPIAVTHTHNDLACTLAYAFASRLSGTIAAAIGDKDDLYGAMGANGPQGMDPGAFVPDETGTSFHPTKGKVNTFLADAYIVKVDKSDAHNNVTNAEVGRLVASVLNA